MAERKSFFDVTYNVAKKGVLEVYPDFIVGRCSNLMIRGSDFYAVWLPEKGLWSTDIQELIDYIDHELDIYATKLRQENPDTQVKVLYMRKSKFGTIDNWLKYTKKQMPDHYVSLDSHLTFSNDNVKKTDYVSKRLPYPLEEGPHPSWDKLIGTLYLPEERHKWEWAIGSIVAGDSSNNQKFVTVYGEHGTGKSTIFKIIRKLFEGYCETFNAKTLGSSNSFALEAFRNDPLVAIEDDGDLSRIEDNTKLNSLVSHEPMMVNEKFKSAYTNTFKTFLFLGTNKPVKITDARSGLLRRLIDIHPSGNKIPRKEYDELMKMVMFELGAIAYHCKQVYLEDPRFYDEYVPVDMLGATNDFYNFMDESYLLLKREDMISLNEAYQMYLKYCDIARVPEVARMSRRVVKEELKPYFREYKERARMNENGERIRNVYSGFRSEKFDAPEKKVEKEPEKNSWLDFSREGPGPLDEMFADCPAQLAVEEGTVVRPEKKWVNCKTLLKDLDPTMVHYLKAPPTLVTVDFDIPDADGNKNFELNRAEAEKWPPTYAELSKSGAGIHLEYIYTGGDPALLSSVYDDKIEIKVCTGNSALRRKLTKHNGLPLAYLGSGRLPLREDKKMVDKNVVTTEKGIRTLIKRNLNKEYCPGTKPSIDFIHKILEDAYNNPNIVYDVSDMRNAVYGFAIQSTHQAEYCIKKVNEMHFKSAEEVREQADLGLFGLDEEEAPIAFFDIEVFPNLLLVNYKLAGEENPVVRMINPEPADLDAMCKYRLIGFNCRRYDNHIIYARIMGYTIEQCYRLSQKIINNEPGCLFSEAYNLSYTDVYDFASSANKMSLKKLEIQMGITHKELGLPWDEPVDVELWEKVAEYCDNDVIATEAAFHYLEADWTARQILSELSEMPVNSTTNSLTQRIIFGKNRKPQSAFQYRDLGQPYKIEDPEIYKFLTEACPDMIPFCDDSDIPFFPGYKFEKGVSTYRDIDILNDSKERQKVGEGGFVYSEPGMYGNVALLDVSSMHPHSAIAECLFGVQYTKAFRDIVEGRVSIKHEDWDEVNRMLDGKLVPYVQRVISGEMKSGDLANALKTAINSVYGLTSAKFDNPFRDIRNVDNIVAKRGALFMIDLMHEVQERGFTVAHIKTDSIKIPDATPEIIQFVMEFGQKYGYSFEHEATYDRMCLVNKAVYIAKYKDADECVQMYGYIPDKNRKKANQWTPTGDQFAVPYVFKRLFSKEEIVFEDMCETFSVSKGDLYLDFNEDLPDVSVYEKELDKTEEAYKKGTLSDTMFEQECARLNELIETGHDLHFVGRVGLFCPVKPGYGGGVLYRRAEGKNYAATGSKGYLWMESADVKRLGLEHAIDTSYYTKLVDDAIATMVAYGNFEWFVSDDPYLGPNIDDLYFNSKEI